MTLLDFTFPTPAENLACDEALLDAAETGESGEVLRFWESPGPFVVLGYANRIMSEVNVTACKTRGIPILRRCSGGGTVVQGPGCLNYAVVLGITESGPTRSINSTNQYVMERNRRAIESALRTPHSAISIQGHTDLVLDNLKFSGNAQRRRKSFLLFHGSLLLNFDLALISALLNMPSLQPEYRSQRCHGDFVMNLNLSTQVVKDALATAWQAPATPTRLLPCIATDLIAKYQSAEWNEKF